MKVLLRSLDVFPMELPLRQPLTTSRGVVRCRQIVFVRASAEVEDAAGRSIGVESVGESAPLEGWSTESASRTLALLRAIAADTPTMVDAAAPEQRWAALAEAPCARFAIEVALLDAVAKGRDLPLWALLDGAHQARGIERAVRLNATVGAVDPLEAAVQARMAVSNGFGCIKIKVGGASLESDEARLSAVRDAVGSRVGLRIDANGAWSPAEAAAALERLSRFELDYVEEPIKAARLEDWAALRDAVDVPIAADESAHPVARAERLVARQAVDRLVLKPMALGGLLRTRRLAHGALDAGLGVTLTSFIDSAVARTAVAHLAASLPESAGPHGLATDWFVRDVAASTDPVAQGRFGLPAAPGLGRAFRIGGGI